MNQMVFVWNNVTMQLLAERDLQLTRLTVIISPYLTQFIKHDKSNVGFFHDIGMVFSPIYSSGDTYVISSFSLMTELYELIPEVFYEFIDHLREKQYIQQSLITRTVRIYFLSMDFHLLPNSWCNYQIYKRQTKF